MRSLRCSPGLHGRPLFLTTNDIPLPSLFYRGARPRTDCSIQLHICELPSASGIRPLKLRAQDRWLRTLVHECIKSLSNAFGISTPGRICNFYNLQHLFSPFGFRKLVKLNLYSLIRIDKHDLKYLIGTI